MIMFNIKLIIDYIKNVVWDFTHPKLVSVAILEIPPGGGSGEPYTWWEGTNLNDVYPNGYNFYDLSGVSCDSFGVIVKIRKYGLVHVYAFCYQELAPVSLEDGSINVNSIVESYKLLNAKRLFVLGG